MRHGMVNRKLGRTSAHRNAMFRNQLASLIDKERIITTLPKAKELRPQIERLITLGKNDSVHARRQAERVIADDAMVGKLFDTIGPRFAERPGGYTRIIKLGARRGDAAEMAILEFVGYEIAKEEPSAPAPKSKPVKKAAPAAEPAATESSDEEAAPKKKAPAKKAAAPKKEAKEAKGKGKGGDDDKPAKKKTSSKKSK
jgi:large subunit ribosomal protein L17